MGLKVADSVRVDACLLEGFNHQVPLAEPEGRKQADGLEAVGVGLGVGHRRVDPFCLGAPLQQKRPHRFRAHKAVCILVKDLALAVGGQQAQRAEDVAGVGGKAEVAGGHYGHLGDAAADVCHRLAEGDQTAAAGGVEDGAGADQVEEEADAVGQQRLRAAVHPEGGVLGADVAEVVLGNCLGAG